MDRMAVSVGGVGRRSPLGVYRVAVIQRIPRPRLFECYLCASDLANGIAAVDFSVAAGGLGGLRRRRISGCPIGSICRASRLGFALALRARRSLRFNGIWRRIRRVATLRSALGHSIGLSALCLRGRRPGDPLGLHHDPRPGGHRLWRRQAGGDAGRMARRPLCSACLRNRRHSRRSVSHL